MNTKSKKDLKNLPKISMKRDADEKNKQVFQHYSVI